MHEPVNTRMPCSGWWMPDWCIKGLPQLRSGPACAAYDDLSAFKIYLVDVGLLRRLAQLPDCLWRG